MRERSVSDAERQGLPGVRSATGWAALRGPQGGRNRVSGFGSSEVTAGVSSPTVGSQLHPRTNRTPGLTWNLGVTPYDRGVLNQSPSSPCLCHEGAGQPGLELREGTNLARGHGGSLSKSLSIRRKWSHVPFHLPQLARVT